MGDEIPKLLMVSRLTEPLANATGILERLGDDVSTASSDTRLQGALVMAVAAVEVALSDSLRYYLCSFPQKLSKQTSVPVDVLPANTVDLLAVAAEREAVGLGYKSFPEYVKYYESTLSIEKSCSEIIDAVQEIKATRNLVLHNGMKANDAYIEQAGRARRVNDTGAKVEVDFRYVAASVAMLAQFVQSLSTTVGAKYAQYTKIAAHRALWSYMFSSPVMPHSDFWEVDEGRDRIVALKRGRYEDQISASERLFLGLWRAHFNGDGQYLTGFNVHAFDSSNTRKLHLFLSVARDFPWS